MQGERPRIAIDAREMKDLATGIGNYVHNLLERLPGLDPAIDYYFLRNGRPIHDFDIRTPNAQFIVSPEYTDQRWEEEFVPSFLRSHDIDVYHSTRNGFLTFWPPGRTYVVTIHDLIPLIFPDRYPAEWVQLMRERMPAYLSGAEMIMADSNCAKRDVQRLVSVNENALRVIYLGIESSYGPMPRDEARVRLKERFGLEGDYIFYIGGFSFRKNVCGLVKAYSLLPEDTKRAYRLVLGGCGRDSFNETVRYVNELGLNGRVLFTGPAPCSEEDLRCLHSRASLFVYPSMYEGFGLPPLEAMACGAPVITSDRGALPEVSGEGALVVDPDDCPGLGGAMLRVLTDAKLRHSLVEKGSAVARRFSWDKNARETLDVYRAVLRKLGRSDP